MTSWWRSPSGINWRAAALLGLVSSTFSTIVSQLTAARIGRDAVRLSCLKCVLDLIEMSLNADARAAA